MDNTLLSSRIDFPRMKRDTFLYLAERGLVRPDLDLNQHTTATIISEATRSNRMSEEQLSEMWKIAARYEIEGMRGAVLEEGAAELLHHLHGSYKLAVVTNNALEAARAALTEHQILHLFDLVVGRELVRELKPSAEGFRHVLAQFSDIPPQEWISVGDAWIDGAASQVAGIPFIAYRADMIKIIANGVNPMAEIANIMDLKSFLA